MALRTAACTALACVTAVAAALLVAAPATAQWVWKDEGGHVVASDRPPPTTVPQSRIIKEPKGRSTKQQSSPPAPDTAARTDAPKSLADRELESKQRQKESADAAKKSDEEAAKAKGLQENCNAVRGNLAALQAGGRAARFNEKGERVYLDDTQRADEIAKAQGQIGQFCK